MSNKFKTTWFYAPLSTYNKRVKTGILSTEEKTFDNERQLDFNAFCVSLNKVYEQMDSEGYDVINVMPISMGSSEPCLQTTGNYVGEVGFSITRGAVIVGKKFDAI